MVAEHEIEHKPYVFTTVGFFIRSDDVGVSIASELGEDGRFRGHTFIPRLMVIEEHAQGEVRLRRKRAKKTTAHPELPVIGSTGAGSQ